MVESLSMWEEAVRELLILCLPGLHEKSISKRKSILRKPIVTSGFKLVSKAAHVISPHSGHWEMTGIPLPLSKNEIVLDYITDTEYLKG